MISEIVSALRPLARNIAEICKRNVRINLLEISPTRASAALHEEKLIAAWGHRRRRAIGLAEHEKEKLPSEILTDEALLA